MRTPTLLAFAAVLLAACTTPHPSNVDENFGEANLRARAAQVVDPDAPMRKRAPIVTDGQAAKSAIDRYQKSFENPPPPVNVLNIGVGSGTTTP